MVLKNPGGERSGGMSADIEMELKPTDSDERRRVSSAYDDTEHSFDASREKRLYDEIAGLFNELDRLIGKGGYSIDRTGRVDIKVTVPEERKRQILEVESLLISLYAKKNVLETK